MSFSPTKTASLLLAEQIKFEKYYKPRNIIQWRFRIGGKKAPFRGFQIWFQDNIWHGWDMDMDIEHGNNLTDILVQKPLKLTWLAISKGFCCFGPKQGSNVMKTQFTHILNTLIKANPLDPKYEKEIEKYFLTSRTNSKILYLVREQKKKTVFMDDKWHRFLFTSHGTGLAPKI